MPSHFRDGFFVLYVPLSRKLCGIFFSTRSKLILKGRDDAMTRDELDKYRNASPEDCSFSSLADLKSISIDTSEPVDERINALFDAMHNPYLFRVGDVTVKVNFKSNESLSDMLIKLLQ